jgi:hypothetical protein
LVHIDATIYKAWVSDEADRTISDTAVTIRSAKDGSALGNYCNLLPCSKIFNMYGTGWSFFIISVLTGLRVLPAVKRNISSTPMTLAFQLAISTTRAERYIPHDTVRAVFAEVISAISNSFGLLALGTLVTPSPPTSGIGRYSSLYRQPAPVLDAERSRDIALLLCHCQTLHLTPELELLVSKLAEEARAIDLDRFTLIFLPFLKILGSTIQELKIAAQLSPFQHLFQQVLCTYIERYVQPEPQPSKDWSRPTITCDCQDCHSLNTFLANPNQKTHSFRIPGKRRDHMLSKVSDTGIEQYTDKTKPSSFSLVLTKNDKYFKIVHKAWEERCVVAKEHIQALDAEIGLMPFLAELYEPIVSLSMVSSSAAREYEQLPLPPSASAGNSIQGPNESQPLAPIANNIQGARILPGLSSVIAGQWTTLPNAKPETRIVPHGTKRKASEVLEQGSKRKATEVVVIDD